MTELSRLAGPIQSRLTYWYQRSLGTGIDPHLERRLGDLATDYRHSQPTDRDRLSVQRYPLNHLQIGDTSRYEMVRGDIYRRFVADETGTEIDSFGRRGGWTPRGSKLYLDTRESVFVKVFDSYFCERGEGRFLGEALAAGLYDLLCPGLEFMLVDGDSIRGYGIRAGIPLSRYQFERYVGGCLRPVVCGETARTGFYFNDLEFHNVVLHDGVLSFIDLESVLPVAWFGTDSEFARDHLDQVDIGWPIQAKWNSPDWYRDFLETLQAPSGDDAGGWHS